MIVADDRQIATCLLYVRIFRLRRSFLGPPELFAIRGFVWLFEWMRRRQTRDGLHHAPACPGNEWAGQKLVFQLCNCGADKSE